MAGVTDPHGTSGFATELKLVLHGSPIRFALQEKKNHHKTTKLMSSMRVAHPLDRGITIQEGHHVA